MLQKLFIFLTVASFFLKAQSQQNKSIEDYKSLLKSFDTNTRSLNINQANIKKYAKLYYEAYTNSPEELALLINREEENLLKSVKNKNEFRNLSRTTLKQKEFKLRKEFENHFSPLKNSLIVIPLIIKGKIVEKINEDEKIDEHSDLTFSNNHLKIEVEDIIKAKKSIKKGSILNVTYADFWVGPNAKWEKGKTYLFFLEYRTDLTDSVICIVTYLDGDNYGYYPIRKGVLQDNNKFFKQGKLIKWKTFKSNLLKTINSIFD